MGSLLVQFLRRQGKTVLRLPLNEMKRWSCSLGADDFAAYMMIRMPEVFAEIRADTVIDATKADEAGEASMKIAKTGGQF